LTNWLNAIHQLIGVFHVNELAELQMSAHSLDHVNRQSLCCGV